MDQAKSNSFREAYEGRLSGLLAWRDVDALFALMETQPEGWWVYDTRMAAVPEACEPAPAFPGVLERITAFLRRWQRADYCGFVYVDDRERPTLVKVYDPRNASSCGLGKPVPVYTISRMRPENLPFADDVIAPKGLIARLTKRLT